MHQILRVYEDPMVADSMDRHEIVPDEVLDGGNHTLYLTSSSTIRRASGPSAR